MIGHRSHSAAPMDSPSVRYRGRSQSPTGHRSLSPPEHRSIPYSHGYVQTTRYKKKIYIYISVGETFDFSRGALYVFSRWGEGVKIEGERGDNELTMDSPFI